MISSESNIKKRIAPRTHKQYSHCFPNSYKKEDFSYVPSAHPCIRQLKFMNFWKISNVWFVGIKETFLQTHWPVMHMETQFPNWELRNQKFCEKAESIYFYVFKYSKKNLWVDLNFDISFQILHSLFCKKIFFLATKWTFLLCLKATKPITKTYD